jgi:hypothetical protein
MLDMQLLIPFLERNPHPATPRKLLVPVHGAARHEDPSMRFAALVLQILPCESMAEQGGVVGFPAHVFSGFRHRGGDEAEGLEVLIADDPADRHAHLVCAGDYIAGSGVAGGCVVEEEGCGGAVSMGLDGEIDVSILFPWISVRHGMGRCGRVGVGVGTCGRS